MFFHILEKKFNNQNGRLLSLQSSKLITHTHMVSFSTYIRRFKYKTKKNKFLVYCDISCVCVLSIDNSLPGQLV